MNLKKTTTPKHSQLSEESLGPPVMIRIRMRANGDKSSETWYERHVAVNNKCRRTRSRDIERLLQMAREDHPRAFLTKIAPVGRHGREWEMRTWLVNWAGEVNEGARSDAEAKGSK